MSRGMFGRKQARLMRVRPPPPPEPEPLPNESLVTPQGAEETPSVVWTSNRCPYCRSQDLLVRKTQRISTVIVRLVRCKTCQGKFKATEDVAQ